MTATFVIMSLTFMDLECHTVPETVLVRDNTVILRYHSVALCFTFAKAKVMRVFWSHLILVSCILQKLQTHFVKFCGDSWRKWLNFAGNLNFLGIIYHYPVLFAIRRAPTDRMLSFVFPLLI